jgi:hypothetical protein
MQLKRGFLLGVVLAISVAALLGVWILLFESFFGIEGEVFATLGSVVLFCLPALTASGMLEKGHWRVVNVIALWVSVAGLVLFLLVIWVLQPLYRSNIRLWEEPLWKSMALAAIWAIALPWGAMLARTQFRDWYRWLRFGSIFVVYLTAASLSLAAIFEADDEPVWKLLGVLGILTALGTIALPILYKVRGMERDEQVESTPLEMTIICPRCLTKQTVSSGPSRCRRCKLKFTIEIEEPRCPKCNYLLHQLTRPVCPECGAVLGAEEVAPVSV